MLATSAIAAPASLLIPSRAFAAHADSPETQATRSRSAESTESAVLETAVLPTPFLSVQFGVRTLATAELPFGTAMAPRTDNGIHDASGVRMRYHFGELLDHPAQQGAYGLENLNSFRVTHDPFFLERAKSQAGRLIDRATQAGSASFYPYGFEFDAMEPTMTPPWYSGLAQGYSLMLFSRLLEATGGAGYRTAADRTFASFLRLGPSASPWVAQVDADQHLWLEEYPGPAPDHTYNGLMVAALGLYDYYRTTGDLRALALFRGAATTVLDEAIAFRQRGWRSVYCGRHRKTASPGYHEVHVRLFLDLFRITGDSRFAQAADAYENDYARDQVSGSIVVKPGTYSLTRFDSRGRPVSRLTLGASSAVRLPVTYRRRILGQSGYWFFVSEGRFRGYWIREHAPRVAHPGTLVRLDYSPTRVLRLAPGRSALVRKYRASGAVAATKVLRAESAGAGLQAGVVCVRSRAVISGRSCALIAGGPYDGYWLDLDGATLD